jgi:hypothetical protein
MVSKIKEGKNKNLNEFKRECTRENVQVKN